MYVKNCVGYNNGFLQSKLAYSPRNWGAYSFYNSYIVMHQRCSVNVWWQNCQQIGEISYWNNTVVRRIHDMADDIEQELIFRLQSCVEHSL